MKIVTLETTRPWDCRPLSWCLFLFTEGPIAICLAPGNKTRKARKERVFSMANLIYSPHHVLHTYRCTWYSILYFVPGKAVCYAGLLLLGCKQTFFCFQVSFCPVKRWNRVGSFRNEFDYSREGTQISFPLLDSRSCENFGLLIFQFSCWKKKVYQTEPPFWSTVSFLTTQLKNEPVRNSRNCYCREAENWSGYLSESSQTHSEKSRLDFLALRGKNWLESKKISVCNHKKKVPHNNRPMVCSVVRPRYGEGDAGIIDAGLEDSSSSL